MPLHTYIVKHNNENIRAESRSGGVFTALSDFIIEQDGIVFGCMLNERFEAIHSRATTKAERNSFRGSKYVQSNVGNTFLEAKSDLKDGKLVLYSGTPCQIAGLKSYLRTEDAVPLVCVDIVCHGVPSPGIWQEYLRYSEKCYKGNVTNVDFINKKKYGWSAHYETISVNNKEYDSKIWTTLFGKHYILRPACFQCPYKKVEHIADITIGDAWGIKQANPEFDDNKGVSLVLINTDKGNSLFEKVKDNLCFKEVDLQDYMQPSFVAPYSLPHNRDSFWRCYHKGGFERVVKKYIELGLVRRAVRKILRTIGIWRE